MMISFQVVLIGVVMILALIGMIACAKKQRTNPNAQPIAIALLIVVVICGIAILVKTGTLGDNANEKLIQNELKFATATAIILGEELKSNYPNEKVLVVVDRNFDKNTRQQKLVEGLKKGLGTAEVVTDTLVLEGRKRDNPPVAAAPGAPPLPPEEDIMPLEELMKASDFDAVIEKNPDCKIVVSLIGLPRDFNMMKTWNLENRPKIALLNADVHLLMPLIRAGYIAAVVSYCPGVKFSEDPAPNDPKAAFDLRYLMVTPKNVDELAQKHQGLFQ